jgi:hypothetical protein
MISDMLRLAGDPNATNSSHSSGSRFFIVAAQYADDLLQLPVDLLQHPADALQHLDDIVQRRFALPPPQLVGRSEAEAPVRKVAVPDPAAPPAYR